MCGWVRLGVGERGGQHLFVSICCMYCPLGGEGCHWCVYVELARLERELSC